MPESISLVENTDEKERESDDHNTGEEYIEIRSYFSIVSEHDLDISELPPEIYPEKYENHEYSYEIRIAKWFHQIGKHRSLDVRRLES